MKGIILLTTFISASLLVRAQSVIFEEITPLPPAPQNIANFSSVVNGDISFADVDGDNDQDVLITGDNYLSHPIAELYINDGVGNYSLVIGTPFTGVEYGSIAFADIDNDNDQDVLITGTSTSGQISKLYTNNGNGYFTLVSGTPFTGVGNGSIAFADIDGDNDQDVLITGYTNLSTLISELYKNDGVGNYTLVNGTPFPGVLDGRIAFADIDNDSDLDLLITGEQTNSPVIISQLYKNDGAGNYTLFDGTSISPIEAGSVNFSDLDNDQDLVITGFGISELYLNDGNGDFIKVLGVPFTGVTHSSSAIADIDNDGDQDIIISGKNVSNNPTTVLYTNDGIGNFALVTGTIFSKISDGSIAFADVDNDNDQDLLITGKNFSINPIAELYLNNGAGNFTYASGMPFVGVKYSSVSFSDIDGDQDQDLIIIGQNTTKSSKSKLYRNLSITAGIKDNGLITELIEVYPNPVSNELTIENQGNINQIEIYNITGQLLQTVNPTSSVVKINFSTYVQGVYLVKVYALDGQVATSRVVKE